MKGTITAFFVPNPIEPTGCASISGLSLESAESRLESILTKPQSGKDFKRNEEKQLSRKQVPGHLSGSDPE